jgi:hypothetical protein
MAQKADGVLDLVLAQGRWLIQSTCCCCCWNASWWQRACSRRAGGRSRRDAISGPIAVTAQGVHVEHTQAPPRAVLGHCACALSHCTCGFGGLGGYVGMRVVVVTTSLAVAVDYTSPFKARQVCHFAGKRASQVAASALCEQR